MISSVLTSLPHSQPDGPSTDEKKKSNKKVMEWAKLVGKIHSKVYSNFGNFHLNNNLYFKIMN